MEGCIFEKAKESLNKIGMYAGEKEKTDYDPDINSISKRDLEVRLNKKVKIFC